MDNDTISRQAASAVIANMEAVGYYPYATIGRLDALLALRRIPSAERWIPVTERLPAEEGLYLVTCFNERPMLEVAWFYIDEEGFGYFSCDWSDFDSVTAWMPLPTPYKGGEEE